MKRRKFVAAILASLVVVPSTGVRAGINPQPFRTGLFGITVGQAVRVSVLNAGIDRGTVNSCFPPDPVAPAVVIRGLDGTALLESNPEKLLPGAGTFVDFVPDFKVATSTSIRVLPPRRLQVRAEVRFTEEDLIRVKCSGVALTLEVYDMLTGRTELTLPFNAVMFNPQPEPPEPIVTP
jgi:hypothetical protein